MKATLQLTIICVMGQLLLASSSSLLLAYAVAWAHLRLERALLLLRRWVKQKRNCHQATGYHLLAQTGANGDDDANTIITGHVLYIIPFFYQ